MIDTLFEVFNILILLYIVIRLSIKELYPSIRQAMIKDHSIFLSLKYDQKDLLRAQDRVQEEIEEQRKKGDLLLERIKLWQQTAREQNWVNTTLKEHRQQELREKIKKQSEQHMLDQLERELAPDVIHELEIQARSYYGQTEHGNIYIGRSIKNLVGKE